jgi:hypothetical protein
MTQAEADKLDAIATALGELSIAFAKHDAKEEACRKRVHDLSAEVWGNGKDGLKTRVDRIEQRSHLLWGAACVGAAVAGFLADKAVTLFGR